jgi:hypothetical protein
LFEGFGDGNGGGGMLTKNDKGKLDYYAFPGGYDIRYLCKDGETVCAKCANEWIEDEDSWQDQEPIEAYIDWEGDGCYCANCNEHLPSEYGEVEE